MRRLLFMACLGGLAWLLGLAALVVFVAGPEAGRGGWAVAAPAASALALGGGVLGYAGVLAVRLRVLRGWLPICSGCKRIRDGEGAWVPLEAFVEEHSHAEFTHGLCGPCMERLRARTAAS